MKVQVCMWKKCKERYSEYIYQRLERDKERFDMNNVILSTCACQDKCKEWPVVIFDKKTETRMDPIKASKIMMNKWKQKKKKKNSDNSDDNE